MADRNCKRPIFPLGLSATKTLSVGIIWIREGRRGLQAGLNALTETSIRMNTHSRRSKTGWI